MSNFRFNSGVLVEQIQNATSAGGINGRGLAGINYLTANLDLPISGWSFLESYLLDNHVWTYRILCPFLGCVKTLLGGRSLLERRIGSMLSRTPEEDIYSEQSQGADSDADFSTFFPRWSVIFAPFGIWLLGWGWWNIRSNSRIHFAAFLT